MNLFNIGRKRPATHDYSKRCWGHDYTFTPTDGGKKASMMGWGNGIESGDFLILQNGEGTTRYKVKSIEYKRDPSDMWSAQVEFAPRN
jgi:hypothetical protein